MPSLTSVATKRAVFLVLLVAIGACGGSSDSTSPDTGSNSGLHLTAKVDGAAFVASNPSLTTANQVSPGQYTIVAFQGATSINLSLTAIRAPGTYPLGVGPGVPGGSVIVANATGGWSTVLSGAEGTITITTLSTTEIAGTFSFTVSALSGSATGTKTVTDGDFHLGVKQLVAIGAIPDNVGSTLSATIGGTTWNAAFVSASLSTIQGTVGQFLTIPATNSTRGFGISLTGVTGPGTYVLTNSGAVTRQMQVNNVVNPLSNIWSSLGAGGSGSVTITSMTATRIKGTFSGILGPTPGTSTVGTLTVANGTFDIGLP